MFLDDRKKRILKAIIEDYINTAEPIGSRTIARKHELGLSSATIRNEMADLEELGFLVQPHTSSGRVPSDKGYRLYVDELIDLAGTTPLEINNIKIAMETSVNELNQLIRATSVMISQITKYTSMVTSPEMENIMVKAVQVVPIEIDTALVILVVNGGIVRNCLVRIDSMLPPDKLIHVSNYLNEKLAGNSVLHIRKSMNIDVDKKLGIDSKCLSPIYSGIVNCIEQLGACEIYLDGKSNILNYPEFKDVDKAKAFFDTLDEKKILTKLMDPGILSSNDINVQIGQEHSVDEVKDCSLIRTSYSIGQTSIGSLGIIGPTRMDYAKVISSLNAIRKIINDEIIKLIKE